MRARPRTLAQLVSTLGKRLDDTAHQRWSQDEKEEAINKAIQLAWPSWYDVIIVKDTTYDDETYEYDLPYGVEDLFAVYVEPITAGNSWHRLRAWHVDGDTLFLHETLGQAYDNKKMRFVCITPPWELFPAGTADGTDGSTTKDQSTFTSSGSTFITDGVEEGDVLFIKSGANKGKYLIKSVDSETQLTIYGTFPATASNQSFAVNWKTTVPEAYIIHRAAANLFELSGHKGAGQDITEDMEWAQYHAQMAEYIMEKQQRPFPPRRD